MGPDEVAAIAQLAARQHGVISRAQFVELVPGDWARRRLQASGWIARVAPGVLGLAGAPVTWERELSTGLLSLGPEARVSHRAAAALHGFDRADPTAVEFTLRRVGRGHRRPFAVHTTAYLGPLDTVTVRGFRVTSATRTVIDLARLRVPVVELEAAIDSAVRIGLSSPVAIHRRLAELRGPGRWGCRLLDDLLLDSGGHTRLERMFLRLVREAGLPRPRTQVIHRRNGNTFARVDFFFEPYPLVVEVTGQHGHSSPRERTIDAQRRNELLELGRPVVEYTWRHLNGEPAYVHESLRAHLRSVGWPGHPITPQRPAPSPSSANQ